MDFKKIFLLFVYIVAIILIVRSLVVEDYSKIQYQVMESIELDPDFDDSLFFEDNGEICVYQKKVSLIKGDAFLVQFNIDGQDENGGVIAVDLYARGYDRQESELRYSVSEGDYSVSRILTFGEIHPANASLRFFTTGNTKASISNILVQRVKKTWNPNAIVGIFAAVSVSFLLTLWMLFRDKRGEVYVVLAGIIIIQVFVLIFWLTQKSNYYVDELYSLGEAQRFTGVGDSVLYLQDNWRDSFVTAGQLKHRLMLENGESLFDQTPLFALERLLAGKNYFGLLNVSESILGKGSISMVPGIVMNIILSVITEVLLYLMLRTIGVKDAEACMGICWYSFSGLTIGNVVFVRFYALTMFFFAIVLFAHALIWKSENVRVWITGEIITFVCLYLICKNTKLGVPMIASVTSCFFVGLLFTRNWKKCAFYGVPVIGAGTVVLVKLYFIDLIVKKESYLETADSYNGIGDIDRADEVVSTVNTLTLTDVLKKTQQLIEIIITHIMGNALFFGVMMLTIIALLIYVRRKRKTNPGYARPYVSGFGVVMIGVAVVYIAGMLVAMNVVIRYYSPIGILLIIVVASIISQRDINGSRIFVCMAMVVFCSGCLYTNMKGNIDYLYREDIPFHEALADYDSTDSLIVMDSASFQRPLYEAVVWMEDDAKIGQIRRYDHEVTLGDEKVDLSCLSERFLLWAFPDQDISGYFRWLEKNHYTYHLLGTGSAAQVYLCSSDNAQE